MTLHHTLTDRRTLVTTAASTALLLPGSDAVHASMQGATPESTAVDSGYAPVNGLEMYYEIHGQGGTPLVLLHGAYSNIDYWGTLLSGLAATRMVIAVETQAHGRTADIDRPITYEAMADDTAALLAWLEIDQADIVGYSMGGSTAIQVAIRHPALVRKVVAISAYVNSGGYYPEVLAAIDGYTVDTFAGSPIVTEYERLAPDPDTFPVLFDKLTTLDTTVLAWPTADLQGLTAPVFVIIGDADVVRPEHAVDMFRLFGGGVAGDMVAMPQSRLAIIPAATHVSVIFQTGMLLAMIPPFLDA